MLNIAICDDQSYEIDGIISKLNSYMLNHTYLEYYVHSYSSAEALLSDYDTGTLFDIILLDIYMEEKSGIEAANYLRSKNFSGQIIFLTSSTAHALEAYQVNAVQYLLKPIIHSTFALAMDQALVFLQASMPKSILIRSGGSDHIITVEKISYVQTNGHYQEIHLANGQMLAFRSTVTALYEQLDASYFMLVGKSYIINFHFVKKIHVSAITMLDGTELFPPRGSFQKIREQYFAFYQCNNI